MKSDKEKEIEKNLQVTVESGPEALKKAGKFLGTPFSISKILSDDQFIFANYENALVGICRLSSEENWPSLRGMQVKEGFRGKGVGSKILRAFERLVSASPHFEVYCIPYDYLESFYGKIGFKKICEEAAPAILRERISGYRQRNPDKDFIVMKRTALPQV